MALTHVVYLGTTPLAENAVCRSAVWRYCNTFDANVLPVFFWLLGHRFVSRPVNKTVRNWSFRCLQFRQNPGSRCRHRAFLIMHQLFVSGEHCLGSAVRTAFFLRALQACEASVLPPAISRTIHSSRSPKGCQA